MAKLFIIRQDNVRFTDEHHTGLVCVFAGATSGIGSSTLERVFTMVFDSTFYIIGRSEAKFATQRATLEGLNSTNTIVFLEGQFSLISDIDAVSKKVAAEKKVDYLFMSPGMYPLNGAECTSLFRIKNKFRTYPKVLSIETKLSYSYERSPRSLLRSIILLPPPLAIQSPPSPSSITKSPRLERAQRWEREIHPRNRYRP